MDALVAENVMGIALNTTARDHPYLVDGTPLCAQPPHYSTDIAAAWLVVEAMEARGMWCQMRTPFEGENSDGYWAGFTPHSTTGWNGKPDHWTQADDMALAICRASLAACGVPS